MSAPRSSWADGGNWDSTNLPEAVVESLALPRELAMLVKLGDEPAWRTDLGGML